MWEVFKILLLCLISVFIATLTASWLYICVILLVLVVFLHDFDLTTGVERHAISKLKYSYLKVRNLYAAIFQRDQNISSLQYTPTMNSINKQTTSFELSRFNKSGNALSPISNSANSGTFTSRRLIQPRQTSTPLTRTSPWQNSISPAINHNRTPILHNSIVNRSPRYSLSSLTPKSVNNESPSKPTIQTVTGPLLASTRFNVNLGTYTDTKSPGLASRVVQYHNELSGNQTSTHQTKYGSPGQFPIVQLYKKELPILNRPARRCTVRIAPPDPVSYNVDHANTILRDSFVQNNVENTNRQNDTEINTRSVLEALKEISRKRIHTNDDLDDISKRQRKNSVSSSTNSSIHLNKDGKRMREDTPPKPKESCTTPVSSAPKRICVVNEIESSLSSSRLMRLQQGQKRKSSINIPETNKQRRVSNGDLISRETQTTITNGSKSSSQNINKNIQKTTSTAAQTESEAGSGMLDIQLILDSTRRKKKPNEIRSIRDIDEENSTLQFAKTTAVPVKSLFSEAPLEIMKQNKLSVMLSALGGHEPEIIPLPDMTLSALKKKSEDNPDGTDIINKEVVSILSPKNKVKHDKHVTFAIPNSNTTNNDAPLDISSRYNETVSKTDVLTVLPVSISSITTGNVNSFGTTVSFSVPNTPISFSSPITCGTNVSNLPAFSMVSTVGAGINAQLASKTTENNFMFGSVSPSTSKVNINSITTTTNSTNIITSSAVDKSDNSGNKNVINFGSAAPNFNFGSSNLVKSLGGLVPSSNTTVTKNPDDLSKTSSAKSGMPGFQFSSTSAPTIPSAPIAFGSSVPNSSVTFTPSSTAIVASSQPTINFGAKSSAFTNTINAVTTSASTGINFGSTANQQPSSSLLPSNASFKTLAPTTTTTTGSSGMFNFGAKSEAKISTSPTFNFGSPVPISQSQPKTGGFKFDLGKSVATTTVTSSKTETPKNSMFVTAGSSNLNKPGAFSFGASNPATTSTSAFNTPTGTSTSAAVFGIQTTTTSTLTFGAPNKTVSTGMFGAPSTSASTGVFGTPSTTSATGVFGTPNTTSATGVFGTTTTTSSGGAFGAPATTLNSVAFGTPSTTTSAAVFGASNAAPNTGIFGSTPSAAAFGTAKSSDTAPGFNTFGASGSSQNPGFGTTTQNSSTFGFGPATTTQNNAFGSTPATTTSSFAFGSNSSTKPFSFGATTTATTTAAPPMFGSTPSTTSTNLFGGNASSGFSAPGTTSSFGAATTTTQSAFGQQSSSGVFGTASSGFGSGTSATVFGTNTNNTNNNAFGSSAPSNVFGASTQQPSSTFGTGTSSNQGNVFGVGNNNQGSGVFGATNSNNNTFGSTSNASFGGGGFSNNNTQSSGVGNFGSPATQAPSQSGVFAFGNAAQPSSSTPAASNAFQFGVGNQTPKPSGFNFSANANTPNINFASAATPAFNTTSPPAFGSPVPGQFSTPAPATGMFNIGSGSTAPKQRPMIKARRRN